MNWNRPMIAWVAVMVFAWSVLLARCAHASGPVKFDFQQSADCALVNHWDVFAAAGTVPAGDLTGVKVGTVANATGTCGGADIVQTDPVVGAGKMSFWIVAVAADGSASLPSNAVIATTPLARPTLVLVQP